LINAAHAIADVVKQKPGQKGKITIKTSHTNEFVEIQVSDTGIGIPDENKPHIFEPFFTTKGVGKGTGQGLSIAYNCIVKKHGGQITFDSQAGKGTTFTIKLPLSISNSTKPMQQSQTIQT
jgi:signal transduction histidine kinase